MSRSVADVEASYPLILECMEICMKSMDRDTVVNAVESWVEFIRITKEAAKNGTC